MKLSQRSQRTRIQLSFSSGIWALHTLLCIRSISSKISPFLWKISSSLNTNPARFEESILCNCSGSEKKRHNGPHSVAQARRTDLFPLNMPAILHKTSQAFILSLPKLRETRNKTSQQSSKLYVGFFRKKARRIVCQNICQNWIVDYVHHVLCVHSWKRSHFYCWLPEYKTSIRITATWKRQWSGILAKDKTGGPCNLEKRKALW